MSHESHLGKILSKALTIIIVIIVFASFRTQILTDESAGKAFGGLLGNLPFAALIYKQITTILKFTRQIPVFSRSSYMTDFMKLAVMAVLQPIFGGLLSRIFLRVPSQWDVWSIADKDKYLNSTGYKAKEALLNVITAPIYAVISAQLVTMADTWLEGRIGAIGATVAEVLVIAGLTALSIIPLFLAGIRLITAIVWRIVITFGYALLKTFCTNVLCIAVAACLVNGSAGWVGGSIVALIAGLITLDIIGTALRLAIVS